MQWKIAYDYLIKVEGVCGDNRFCADRLFADCRKQKGFLSYSMEYGRLDLS